jgi:UDP-glucuronate 4-epimerase
MAGEPLEVFNFGHMSRDFTYIDDIAEGVVRVADKPASADAAFDPGRPSPATSRAPYRIFNIGNSEPIPLLEYIDALASSIGRPAVKNLREMQAGDVVSTHADTSALEEWIGFKPSTPLSVGIHRFISWYRDYYY